MPDLPDLDTTGVSFIAYWNAVSQGGIAEADMDAEDVLSDGNINSQTLYDNGVIVEYNLLGGYPEGGGNGGTREATMRVKNDGWFVAYIDRTEDFGIQTGQADTIRGPWDIMNAWTGTSTSTIVNNALERAINSLQGQLSASPTYQTSDVGLYNYEHPNADFASMFSAEGGPKTSAFLYTSATNVLWAVATGSAEQDFSSRFVYWDRGGADEILLGGGGNPVFGVVDLLDADAGGVTGNLIPNDSTEYSMFTESSFGDQACVLALWEDTS